MPKITSCLLTHKAEINTETTANVLNLAPAIFPQRGATQSCTRRNLQRLGSHWAGGQRAALALGSARCTVRPFLFTWLHGNFQRKLPAHFSHFHLGGCINSWEQESTRLYVNIIKKICKRCALCEDRHLLKKKKCVHYFVTCPILTNSACRASSFLRADFGDSGSTSLKDRRLSMFWGEKGT